MKTRSRKSAKFETFNPDDSVIVTRPEPETTKQKITKNFVPLEETQVQGNINQINKINVNIPDNIFQKKDLDFDSVVSIPSKLIDIENIIACAVFDNYGLLLASASNNKLIALERIAPWAFETIKSAKNISSSTQEVTWLTTLTGNSICIIIQKLNTGCVILVDMNTEIVHINQLAVNLSEKLEDYQPNKYI